MRAADARALPLSAPLTAVGAAIFLLLGGPAHAQSGAVRAYSLPPQRVQDTLLLLALQARVSLGGDLSACRGVTPRLRGFFTVQAVMTRVLAGTGCTFQVVGDRSIRIHATAPTVTASPAAPAVDPEPVPLEEVVVTIGRRPETLRTLAASASVTPGDRLSGTGGSDLADVAAHTAGMTVTNLGPGRNKVFLRGVSDGAFTGLTQGTVGLYLDRAPVTYSAPDPDLKLVDIDRIEVLRGPQGTLYGAGAISGVVRTVPQRPDPAGSWLDVSTQASRTREGGRNTDLWAVANLAAPQARAALRAVIYDERQDGYINDVSLNLRNINGGRRSGGRLALELRPNPDWSVFLGGVRQRIATEDTHYVLRGMGPFRRANLVREPHDNRFDAVTGRVMGQTRWGRLDLSVARVEHDFASRYDASSALGRFGSFWRIGALDERRRVRLDAIEATLASSGSGPIRSLIGAFASDGETTTETVLAAQVIGQDVPIYAEARADGMRELALFGEASWNARPDLTLTAGGRLSRFAYAADSTVRQRAAVRTFAGDDADTAFTPRLTAAWRASPNWTLTAQVAQGRRAGGFNTAGQAGQSFSGLAGAPARRYRGDDLWTVETGVKARLMEGRADLRAAVFASRWSDVQSDQFLRDGLGYVVNVGDGADAGVEVEAGWRPAPGWDIQANAAFTDPRITRTNPDFSARPYDGLPSVPDRSINLQGRWSGDVGGGYQAFAEGGLGYVGPSRLTFQRMGDDRQGDYLTARLAAGAERGPWRLSVFVENLTDERANTFAYSDPFRLQDAQATTPLRPRTAGVALRWSGR